MLLFNKMCSEITIDVGSRRVLLGTAGTFPNRCIANLFAAFRSNENKKLMDTPGLKDRIGSTGNQFALSILLGTLCILPVWAWREGGRLGPSAATFS